MDTNLERWAYFMARMIEKYGNEVNLEGDEEKNGSEEKNVQM